MSKHPDELGLDCVKTRAGQEPELGGFLAPPRCGPAGQSKTSSLDAGLLAAIDEAAAARGLTRSAFLVSAIKRLKARADRSTTLLRRDDPT